MARIGFRKGIAPRMSPWRWRVSSILVVSSLLGIVGCAPKQRVPLDVNPATVSIYLDGEALEEIPQELTLRSDRDHKLFFKSHGHRSALVVLRSVQGENEARLEPAAIRLRLVPLDPSRRELSVTGAEKRPTQVGSDRDATARRVTQDGSPDDASVSSPGSDD